MRAVIMDSRTILLEDASRVVGLNGGAESLVGPRRHLYTPVVYLTLRESDCSFEFSSFKYKEHFL